MGWSKQRCTLTIGESSSCGSGSPSRRALSRGGTATTTASASSSPRSSTLVFVSTVAPAAGGVAVHLPERTHRQQQVGVAALAEQGGADGEVAGLRARLLAAQVQRR